MPKERCAACGKLFEPECGVYGGSEWCPTCRPSRQDRLIEAHNEALSELKRTKPYIADYEAGEFTRKLTKDMADKDRRNPNARRW